MGQAVADVMSATLEFDPPLSTNYPGGFAAADIEPFCLRLRVPSTSRSRQHFGNRMTKATKNPRVFLALSPAAVATALGVRPDEVATAINDGLLPVHVMGLKRRVHVSDVERWFRSWKQINPKRKAPDHG